MKFQNNKDKEGKSLAASREKKASHQQNNIKLASR
jgi:hypothetical protein